MGASAIMMAVMSALRHGLDLSDNECARDQTETTGVASSRMTIIETRARNWTNYGLCVVCSHFFTTYQGSIRLRTGRASRQRRGLQRLQIKLDSTARHVSLFGSSHVLDGPLHNVHRNVMLRLILQFEAPCLILAVVENLLDSQL